VSNLTPMPLFPAEIPRPTTSEGERIFFRALLKELPKGWTAWHSFRLRSEGTWEGEGDFVFAIPGRAILIVEVKGGRIECSDGQWFQNGKRLEQAPREQAHRLRRILEAKLDETFNGRWPPILIATAFPQTPFQVAPSHGDLTDAVLGQQDLPWLGQALEALVDKQLGNAEPLKDTAWIAALHKLWGETWIPRVTLGMRIKLRENELVPLDADQLALLDAFGRSANMLVAGGPGTGKTLIARALCERRAPALYLCWTRALAVAMRATGVPNAWAVREYAAHLLAAAGVTIQDGAPPDAWTTETWNNVALAAAVDAVPAEQAHELVVVDEAQDFTDGDWDLVKALAGNGPLWGFGDPGQSFWPERAIPSDLFKAEYQLRDRYRCPAGLAAFADRYRAVGDAGAGASASVERIPELRLAEIGAQDKLADRVKLEVTRAIKDGARPEDIAILSLKGQTKSKLLQDKRLGDVKLARADAPDAEDHVIADTFLRFKGLERPYVIVTELGAGEKYDVRMHVALTRATLQAVIVATKEEIAADARLRALVAG
jgi:hypothetical protein